MYSNAHMCANLGKQYCIYPWGSNLTECLIAYTSRTFSDALVLTGYIWGKISHRPPFFISNITWGSINCSSSHAWHRISCPISWSASCTKACRLPLLTVPQMCFNTLKRRQNETPCNRVFQMYFRQWKVYDRDEDFIMISFPRVQLAIIQRIDNGLVLNRHLAII